MFTNVYSWQTCSVINSYRDPVKKSRVSSSLFYFILFLPPWCGSILLPVQLLCYILVELKPITSIEGR